MRMQAAMLIVEGGENFVQWSGQTLSLLWPTMQESNLVVLALKVYTTEQGVGNYLKTWS